MTRAELKGGGENGEEALLKKQVNISSLTAFSMDFNMGRKNTIYGCVLYIYFSKVNTVLQRRFTITYIKNTMTREGSFKCHNISCQN